MSVVKEIMKFRGTELCIEFRCIWLNNLKFVARWKSISLLVTSRVYQQMHNNKIKIACKTQTTAACVGAKSKRSLDRIGRKYSPRYF
jgi:hypothetical protein